MSEEVKESTYMEPWKGFNQICGKCSRLVGGAGYKVKIYKDGWRSNEHTVSYLCKTCAPKVYPNYFKKEKK